MALTMGDIKGDSPQAVALKLLEIVALSEQKPLDFPGAVDSAWILETYKECLRAVTMETSGSEKF